MKLNFIAIALLLTLIALPVMAQDSTVNSVSFNGIGFSFDSTVAPFVNISTFSGDPVESAGPGFSDAAYTLFTLHDNQLHLGEMLEGKGGVRVYRMDDLVQYSFLQEQVEWLRQLLDERPDLATVAADQQQANRLPYIPVLTHGQVLVAQAQYLETEAVKGIRYITANLAAQEPFMSSTFSYTFQGISADDQHYVAVGFLLDTSLFPTEPEPVDPDTFYPQFDQYLAESTTALNQAVPDAFSPSLTALDAIVQSITVES